MKHLKCMNVVFEPIMGYSDHAAMARSYGVLGPGVDKVNVCLRNHSAKQIILSKGSAVGEITMVNAILSLHQSQERMVLLGVR